jgi:hypothetical protein
MTGGAQGDGTLIGAKSLPPPQWLDFDPGSR